MQHGIATFATSFKKQYYERKGFYRIQFTGRAVRGRYVVQGDLYVGMS